MVHLSEHKTKFLIAAIGWTVLIAFLCLGSTTNLPSIKVTSLDKVVHFSMHFVFTMLWVLYFFYRNSANKANNIALNFFLISLFYGILLEIFQHIFTSNRQADFFDILANAFGAFVAVKSFLYLNNRNLLCRK